MKQDKKKKCLTSDEQNNNHVTSQTSFDNFMARNAINSKITFTKRTFLINLFLINNFANGNIFQVGMYQLKKIINMHKTHVVVC